MIQVIEHQQIAVDNLFSVIFLIAIKKRHIKIKLRHCLDNFWQIIRLIYSYFQVWFQSEAAIYSSRFGNIHSKTPALKSLFKKVVGLQEKGQKRLQQRCFSVNIGKFIRTPNLKNVCAWLHLTAVLCTKAAVLESNFNNISKELLCSKLFRRVFIYTYLSECFC